MPIASTTVKIRQLINTLVVKDLELERKAAI
jgi:hypothetical protein